MSQNAPAQTALIKGAGVADDDAPNLSELTVQITDLRLRLRTIERLQFNASRTGHAAEARLRLPEKGSDAA